MDNAILTYTNRLHIKKLIDQGKTYQKMAEEMGIDHTPIFQEVKNAVGRINIGQEKHLIL